jgi:hypothetical protein
MLGLTLVFALLVLVAAVGLLFGVPDTGTSEETPLSEFEVAQLDTQLQPAYVETVDVTNSSYNWGYTPTNTGTGIDFERLDGKL